jgi:Ca2+-binding EF-hand superfamily protein
VQLDQQEREVYDYLFNTIDSDHDGQLRTTDVVELLRKTSIPQLTLAQIWELVNPTVPQSPSRDDFYLSLRLCVLHQSGKPLSVDEATNPAVQHGFPNFTGIQLPPRRLVSQASVGTDASGFNWNMTEHLTKYRAIFPQYDTDRDGYISGLEAKQQIFEKTTLTKDDLVALWELSDTDKDGRLNLREYLLAMGLTYARLKGQPLPRVVPAALIQSIQTVLSQPDAPSLSAYSSPSLNVFSTNPLGSNPNPGGLTSPLTSFSSSSLSLPSLGSTTGLGGYSSVGSSGPSMTPSYQPSTSVNLTDVWNIPGDKQEQYEEMFAKIDLEETGKIASHMAMDIFGKQGMSFGAVGQIWSIADADKDDSLSLIEFCIAMHLVDMKKQGMELPVVLPNNLLSSAQNNHQLAIKRREERSFAEKFRDSQKQLESLKTELITERQRSTDLAKQLKEAQDTIRQLERSAKTGAVAQPAQQQQAPPQQQATHVPLQHVKQNQASSQVNQQQASVEPSLPSPREDFYRGPPSAPSAPSQPAKRNPYDDDDEMPMPGSSSSRPAMAVRTGGAPQQQQQQQPNPFFDEGTSSDPFGNSGGAPVAPPPPPSGGLNSGIQGFDRSKLNKVPQNNAGPQHGGAPKQQPQPQGGFGGNFAMEAQQAWQRRNNQQ